MGTIENLLVDQSPSGILKTASMILRCRLIDQDWPDPLPYFLEPYHIHVGLDDQMVRPLENSVGNPSLVILRDECYVEDNERSKVAGILVGPSSRKSGAFERIAHFYTTESKILEAYHETEETVIELI